MLVIGLVLSAFPKIACAQLIESNQAFSCRMISRIDRVQEVTPIMRYSATPDVVIHSSHCGHEQAHFGAPVML